MNINFSYSHLAEYQKLVYNLTSIESGFFKEVGMFLTSVPNYSSNTVVVPEFKELSTKSFWSSFKKTKKEIPNNYPNYTGEEFPVLFKEVSQLKVLNVTTFEKEWETIANNFNNILNIVFDNDLNQINVYVTYFGTTSSYNLSNNILNIYLRKDADISQIAFCILSYFIHKYKGNLSWREQQRAVDFLMLNTKIKDLFPNFVSILDSAENPELSIKTLLKSELIYKDLGINIKNSIEINESKVFILKEEVTDFSKQERLVLLELVKNKNTVTTFEQISNILWGDDFSSFSLQAIAKTVERLRCKIVNAGLNRQVIFTKRKEGYLLYD